MTVQRRFARTERRTEWSDAGADNVAVLEGTTRYRERIVWPGFADRLLKSGMHNHKIGRLVTRGHWQGMPIFTLTLEERRTCPSTCDHWRDCYGNKMNWSERLMHGPALEWRLGREIRDLLQRHDRILIRLHILGDFYSVDYVKRWLSWLRRWPGLHVYGYTARGPSDPIGALIRAATARLPRWRIRWSNGEPPMATQTVYPDGGYALDDEIWCPAQDGRTECWETDRTILFKAH